MKTVGIKSYSELIFNLLFATLLLPIAFMFMTIALDFGFDDGIHFTLYMSLLLLFTIIVALLFEILKPKELIQYDQNHLYINYFLRQHKIELRHFVAATARRFKIRGFKFDFGKVTIRSIHGKKVIYGVVKCEDVALELTILRESYLNSVNQTESERS